MKNILKGLLKTATQIVKIGDVKNILGNENYIGTGYFGVKRGAIKVLDNLYGKRSEEVKELDYNRLIPTTISGEYEEVKEVNIKVNTTQIISESFLVYLNTSYYLFFSNYIKDLKMYVKSPVDPVILANKENEVLGIVLPLRLKYELVLIPNNNIIAQNNILVDLKNIEIINGKELDPETRDITRQLQFDYYKKGLHAKYSYTRLNKLGFKLSHKNFEEAQTLEDYKKELEIKEQNKIKNNEYLQKLATEYIEYHNKSLSANQSNFNNIVDYTIEKINKVTYIVQCINNNNNKIDYFRLNLLNCDVKLSEQKQIFKMIKDQLVNSTLELQTIEENKINDLSAPEVAAATEEIKENKKINTLYTIQDELQNNNYDTDISTSILSVNKKCRFNKTYRNYTIYISDNGIHEFNLFIFEGDILKGESIKKYLGKNVKYHDVFKLVYDYTNIDIVEEESHYNDYVYSYNNNTYNISISLDGKLFINDNVKYEFTPYDQEEYAKLIYNYEYRYNLICELLKENMEVENMNDSIEVLENNKKIIDNSIDIIKHINKLLIIKNTAQVQNLKKEYKKLIEYVNQKFIKDNDVIDDILYHINNNRKKLNAIDSGLYDRTNLNSLKISELDYTNANNTIAILAKKYIQERHALTKNEFILLFENFVSTIEEDKKELIDNKSIFQYAYTSQKNLQNMNNLLCKNIIILGFNYLKNNNIVSA